MRIETDVQTIRFTVDGERRVYVTPYAVSGYVIAFDRGDDIQPFTFRLNENKRVGAKRKVKTEAGRAIERATVAKKRKEQLVETLEAGLAKGSTLPPPKPAERKAAKRAVVDAAADLASITAAYEGAAKRVTLPGGERKAPPRVYRTGRREYGNRVLAINQAPAQ
jgi:hypothetical protein